LTTYSENVFLTYFSLNAQASNFKRAKNKHL
jgi:hypothetical protein